MRIITGTLTALRSVTQATTNLQFNYVKVKVTVIPFWTQADCSFLALSTQVSLSQTIISTKPVITLPSVVHHQALTSTKLYCRVR